MPSEDDLGGASRATGGVSCSYLHAVKRQRASSYAMNGKTAQRQGRMGGPARRWLAGLRARTIATADAT